jgi:Acetyltransferase (GNAT) domain
VTFSRRGHKSVQSTVRVTVSDQPLTAAEWESLRGRINPEFRFLGEQWLEPWREHLQYEGSWNGQFRYLVARDENGVVLGAIPIAVQRKSRLSLLSLAGPYLPIRGFPVATEAVGSVSRALAHYLTEHPPSTMMRMAPIPGWDPVTTHIMSTLEERGWRLRTTHDARRQVISLPTRFEEYEAERKGSRWSTISRRERKMQREQEAKLSLFTTETCQDWEPVVRAMGQVELQSWLPQKHGDMWFVREADQRFWTQVLSAPQRDLAARAWVLDWGANPVAFNFNFDTGPCRYHIAAHYAEAASSYSPGAILMKHMVRDAIERGLTFIDMGGGDPGYKAYWGSRPQPEATIDCLAFPPTLRGVLLEKLAAGLAYLGRVRQAARTRWHSKRSS